jgi:Family of unknown function (DUF5681)
MPFVKGQSGNPGGRPKELSDVVQLARGYTGPAVQTLAKIMGQSKASATARVTAAIALLDRGWGKPSQAITGEGGGPLEMIVTGVRRAMDEAERGSQSGE